MTVTAKLRYLRIAPRKVRLVADLIRGKSVEEAQTILSFTIKKAAQPLLKILKSAISNAKNNFHLDETNLYISKITVDEGPKYKRWMPRARGQAYEIQKKTSHITIFLDEVSESKNLKIEKKPTKKEKLEIKETSEDKEEIDKEKKKKIKPKIEILKPKAEKGIRRFFRRKAF